MTHSKNINATYQRNVPRTLYILQRRRWYPIKMVKSTFFLFQLIPPGHSTTLSSPLFHVNRHAQGVQIRPK